MRRLVVSNVNGLFNLYELWTDKDSCSSRYVNVHKLRPSLGALWSGERDKVTSTSPETGEVGRVHSSVDWFIRNYKEHLDRESGSDTLWLTVSAIVDPNLAKTAVGEGGKSVPTRTILRPPRVGPSTGAIL